MDLTLQRTMGISKAGDNRAFQMKQSAKLTKNSNKPAPKLKGLKTGCKDKKTAEARCTCDNSCIMSVLFCMQWKHTFPERLKLC